MLHQEGLNHTNGTYHVVEETEVRLPEKGTVFIDARSGGQPIVSLEGHRL
jgi:hypothetical protein